MRRELACPLHGSPRVQPATAHGQASGNGAFSPTSAHGRVGGALCSWGTLQAAGVAQRRSVGVSRVRCGWADLGLSRLSGAPANTSRAGKVEAVENTACGVCVGLLLPPLSYFPHWRKYRQSIHPWLLLAESGRGPVWWPEAARAALPPARGSTQPPASPRENLLLITSLLSLSPHVNAYSNNASK